jgi:hypothetical protein
MSLSKPQLLVIDDEPDAQRDTLDLELAERLEITVLAPGEVDASHLERPSLVLVDFDLGLWPRRAAVPFSLTPPNGVALASALREYANQIADGPVAFAIYSAHLPDLSKPLPPERREHLIARSHNLEWAFPKAQHSSQESSIYKQIYTLARAVAALPNPWPDDAESARRALAKYLGLSEKAVWFNDALRSVDSCQPPIHELSTWSQGVAVTRWLLQRILPHPCFLLDAHYLARELGTTYASLVSALESGLRPILRPYEYRGELADFLGVRWWRAGIEAFRGEIDDGQNSIPEIISATRQIPLVKTPYYESVVCFDEDYQILDELQDLEDAVRLQIDDWPSYAKRPHALITTAREHPSVRNLVDRLDLGKLL